MNDDDILQFPLSDPVAQMKGPAGVGSSVIIEGRLIPMLSMLDHGSEVSLVLDNRLSISVPREMARQVAWFAATAIAIGRGYTHIGGESRNLPFAPRVMEIGAIPEVGPEDGKGDAG